MVTVEGYVFGDADAAIPNMRCRRSKTKHWFSINLKIVCIIGWLNPQPLMDAQI